MNRRLLLALGVLVVGAIVLAEILLRPPADDRLQLVLILVGPALVAVAVTPLLGRWVSSRASVAGAALVVGLCSLLLGAVTSSAASNAMFLSSHDYRLFLVVLLLSSGIALVVGSQLTRPLARDVHRLGQVAQQVAAGDLGVRTGIVRRDEVGATATAIDRMVDTLGRAEQERIALADARRHLFTSIGHDLRTPLAAMRAAVESIQDGVAPDPDRYLGVVATQLSTLDGLLDQLVELARLEAGHRSGELLRVSLAELADECVEALLPLADRRSVHLCVDTDGPATVEGIPSELARVVRNLLDNAVRHSPDGGSVRVVVRERLADTGSTVVDLAVHDDGPGFPEDFREHAFEPFTRADPSRTASTGNSGLGLAICHAIVSAHGGRLWLGPGPGGDVRCSFPTPEIS